jgi:predicted SAM-dependent methyltransferase
MADVQMADVMTASLKKSLVLYPFAAGKRLTAQREIAAYLTNTPSKKLNVGAQTNILPGWLNVDLLPFPGATYMDATRDWPFPDNTFDLILCEHMIEHVSKDDGFFVLQESHRVIAAGGCVRVVTPDMLAFARMALDPRTPKADGYIASIRKRHPGATAHDIVNMIYYGYGHRYIYSPQELAEMMRRAGFTDIRESRAGYPIDGAFEGAEGHPRLLGAEPNAFEAFALEARKAG